MKIAIIELRWHEFRQKIINKYPSETLGIYQGKSEIRTEQALFESQAWLRLAD